MTEPIRILVVEDHHVVRQGLVALVKTVPDMAVVAEASDGKQAVEFFRQHRPDVTIIDGDEDIYRALQAGARGYLLKDMFGEELMDAVRTVHAGKTRIPPAVAQRLAERMGGPSLTGRELDVLKLIASGKSNREIGKELTISEATVKSHINSILSKLSVNDRTQAATSALQRGIIHFE